MATAESYYPAKLADTATLARINEKSRERGQGPKVLPRLFEDANRALLHVGHAVSLERMEGREVALDEVSVWKVDDVEVLFVVWWVRLPAGRTVAVEIGTQAADFLALESTVIGEAMLERAHELAREWLSRQ
jgi:hypothetical protein